MADHRPAAPADALVHQGRSEPAADSPNGDSDAGNLRPRYKSLRHVLRSAHGGRGSVATLLDSTSEEEIDDETKRPVAVLLQRSEDSQSQEPESKLASSAPTFGHRLKVDMANEPTKPMSDLPALKGAKVCTSASDDNELRAILKRGVQRARDSESNIKRKGRFRDFVFTKKFSTFDMRNEVAATSPFHGFFTLFWIAVSVFMLKTGAENWKNTGSPLGTNDIMKSMFQRDVVLLLLSDGIMCGLTGFSWLLQLLIFKGYIDWDGAGWIIQNVWQTIFIGANIGWTQYRGWPWSHTVFFVLHTLVMLMKQHSYAFYNGYLSTAYKKRTELLGRLKQLEHAQVSAQSSSSVSAESSGPEYLNRLPSKQEIRQRRRSLHSGSDVFSQDLDDMEAAIESSKPLGVEQIRMFEKVIHWELDALTEELMGKATSPDGAYPHNLSLQNHYEYIVFPTLIYELEYPRAESINWRYVGEKAAATFGVIFVMLAISQAFIYPVVMRTVAMKEAGMSLADRFQEFPWMLSDLIFPFMMEYLLTWYVIWEAILNLLGELTYFADREFYADWWNSVSWDQFARDWNRPVHNFLLRHVYHSSISAMQVDKHTATLITFFLSACVHELVMWCIFKKLRGYLLMLQMFQLPLVRLSRTRWLKGRQTLGNVFFWVGIFTGPSILCSLYLIL